MMKTKKEYLYQVSIIITSYNYGLYLKSAIESALNQHFPRRDYEIIVVDDGSSDNQTQEALRAYKKDIFLLQRENRGLSVSCNDAIKISRGKYLVRLDADDELLPIHLNETTRILDKRSNIDFVYSNYIERKQCKERLVRLPAFSREEIIKRGDFLAIGTMHRRDVLSEVGLFDESLKILEHFELVLRLLANNKKGYCINKALFIYTKKAGSMSTNLDKMQQIGKKLGKKYGFCYQKNEFMP